MKEFGYKGFDEDLKCGELQCKVGETIDEKEAEQHYGKTDFCENPFDLLKSCSPSARRFCKVEAEDVYVKSADDSKRVAKKLFIKEEVSLDKFVEEGIKYVLKNTKIEDKNIATDDGSVVHTTKNCSAAFVKGNYSVANVTGGHSVAFVKGNYSVANTTDEVSAAIVHGIYSVAMSSGYESAAFVQGCYSAAHTTGEGAGAFATGEYSKSLAKGELSAASAVGEHSIAHTMGEYSVSAASGERTKAICSHCSLASAVGEYSIAIAERNCSVASTMGYRSSAVAGKGSVAIAAGIQPRVKGELGSFLILAEDNSPLGSAASITDVKCVKVDGEKIKANTWYILRHGEFVEADESDYDD